MAINIAVQHSLVLFEMVMHTIASSKRLEVVANALWVYCLSGSVNAKHEMVKGMDRVVVDDSMRSTTSFHKANAKEWRLFMSPRVSNTLSNAAARRSVSMDDEEKLQEEEFKQIFKEVEKLGTSQMSWKKRKEIETQKIVSLGAKPEKGQKMPVAMGRNIKRKRERMEEQKRQDELASGLLATKRAKKGVEKPAASDRGLKASEGVFRGGVLYVKPLLTKTEENTQPSRGKKSFRKGKKSKHKGKRKKR
ncbi:hypothetical protein L7F22_060090 [Adiantum nelumboides]|nr:hypothetical protein [Adiantum nelumboides]